MTYTVISTKYDSWHNDKKSAMEQYNTLKSQGIDCKVLEAPLHKLDSKTIASHGKWK